MTPSPRYPFARRALLALAIALALLTACKDEPTTAWAKQTYPTHKPTFDAIRADIEPLFTQLAPLPYTRFDQDPAKLQAQQDAQQRRINDFDESALKALQRHESLIGWELTYSFPDIEQPPIHYSFSKLSSFKPSYKGGVTVVAGSRDVKTEEGHRLGWGMYKVRGKEMRKSLGMEAPRYFKGLEVLWTSRQQDAELKVRLYFVEPSLLKDE